MVDIVSWTKRQFVTTAFSEIGLAEYNFDLQPEQLESGLRKLDAMMAQWQANGIKLGYAVSVDLDLDEDSRVSDFANEAIYLNLALRLAGEFGKAVSMELKQNAKDAKDALLRSLVIVPKMRLPTNLPSGAGLKYYGNFIYPTKDNRVEGLTQDVDFTDGF